MVKAFLIAVIALPLIGISAAAKTFEGPELKFDIPDGYRAMGKLSGNHIMFCNSDDYDEGCCITFNRYAAMGEDQQEVSGSDISAIVQKDWELTNREPDLKFEHFIDNKYTKDHFGYKYRKSVGPAYVFFRRVAGTTWRIEIIHDDATPMTEAKATAIAYNLAEGHAPAPKP